MDESAPQHAGTEPSSLEKAMDVARDQHGRSLLERSKEKPVLVVFLRHAGCPFCRETSSDIAQQRQAIEVRGTDVVLVHMMDDARAEAFFESYGLGDLPRISDPERHVYRAFDLKRGNLWQIGGPRVWWRSIQAHLAGHRIGKAVGDTFQLPGVFLVENGRIVRAYRHRSQADRPDYVEISGCSRDGRP